MFGLGPTGSRYDSAAALLDGQADRVRLMTSKSRVANATARPFKPILCSSPGPGRDPEDKTNPSKLGARVARRGRGRPDRAESFPGSVTCAHRYALVAAGRRDTPLRVQGLPTDWPLSTIAGILSSMP